MPSQIPKPLVVVLEVIVAVTAVGSLITTDDVTVHPRLSVTVTVYVLAESPDKSSVETEFDQLYVYVRVPPLTVKFAVPVVPPLQRTSVPAILAIQGVGSVITTDEVAVQPLASVTVTFHVPAVKPVAVDVVCAGAGSFHK